MTNLKKTTTNTWLRLNAKDGRFAFTGCRFIFHPTLRRSECGWKHKHGNQLWQTGWIINQQANRQTHRDFHIFGSCFHLSGGRQEEEEGGGGGEEEEEEWHWSPAGKIWFPANNRLPLWAVKETARCSLFRRTKTWLLTVKERIEEKNVPSSYLESLERTQSKTAANCRQRGGTQWQFTAVICSF